MAPEIETPGLTLRAEAATDATEIDALCADLAIKSWLARPPHACALRDAEAFLAPAAGAGQPIPGGEAPGNRPVAMVGIDLRVGRGEFGLRFGRACWRRGRMSEAARPAGDAALRDGASRRVPGAPGGQVASLATEHGPGPRGTGRRRVRCAAPGREPSRIDTALGRARREALA
jgi:RimJ/RimL family protein N-acetyltransferase